MNVIFRTILVMAMLVVFTTILGLTVVIAAALRIPRRKGGVYEWAPRVWSKALLIAAGTKVVVHDGDRYRDGKPYIFMANHLSLFDIPAVLGALPPHYFIAKSELFEILVFGAGIRAIGTIPIQRTNQKAAFTAYTEAAKRIRDGSSVVVFPEGTRGFAYDIRPFKKGPFVLAIEAGVPIVPVIIHGTLEILPKHSLRLRSGQIDVHLLDAVPTEGYTYEDRDKLSKEINDRMARAMNSLYLNS